MLGSRCSALMPAAMAAWKSQISKIEKSQQSPYVFQVSNAQQTQHTKQNVQFVKSLCTAMALVTLGLLQPQTHEQKLQ